MDTEKKLKTWSWYGTVQGWCSAICASAWDTSYETCRKGAQSWSWLWASNVPLQQKNQQPPGLHKGEFEGGGGGDGGDLPICTGEIWWRTLSLDSPFWSKTWIYILEWVQKWDVNMIKGLEDLQYEEWLREMRLCSLEKPIMCVNMWWRQSKEDRLFSIAHCSARGSEHKVKHRKFCLNTKTVFFQRWLNTCTGYPERLCRVWRYSKLSLTQP